VKGTGNIVNKVITGNSPNLEKEMPSRSLLGLQTGKTKIELTHVVL
jgi:hypothetical protein